MNGYSGKGKQGDTPEQRVIRRATAYATGGEKGYNTLNLFEQFPSSSEAVGLLSQLPQEGDVYTNLRKKLEEQGHLEPRNE